MAEQSSSKSPFSKEELEHFKQLLQEEREASREEMKSLKDSVGGLTDNQDDKSSSQAHHTGDLGTEEEEKETIYTLMQREQNKVKEIDDALDRIENGSYGICEKTGNPIKKERLEVIPYARRSIEAQEEEDSGKRSPQV